MDFTIRIGSCPMDPIHSIGTAFYPLVQHGLPEEEKKTLKASAHSNTRLSVQYLTHVTAISPGQ